MAEQDYQEDVIRIVGDEKLSEADKIKALHALGFSRKALIEEFDFSKTSVYRALPVSREEKAAEHGYGLPALRKMGGGVEMITPEAVLRQYMDGGEHEEWELRGMMKLRAAMLMVMDLVNIQKSAAEAEAKRLEPLLKILTLSREELDAAAARARGSSMEIAQQAAAGVIDRVIAYLDQKIPKGPPPKDMGEMFTKRIDKMWDMMDHMMEQRMFPGYGANKPPEGWEYEKVNQNVAASSSPPQNEAPAAQPGRGTPPGWEKEDEKKEETDV